MTQRTLFDDLPPSVASMSDTAIRAKQGRASTQDAGERSSDSEPAKPVKQAVKRAERGIYFNTNGERGDVLAESRAVAGEQELAVLALYRRWGDLTPCQAWTMLGRDRYHLTSIRRAVTVLTDRGLLEMTGGMRQGHAGKMVHVWALAANPRR